MTGSTARPLTTSSTRPATWHRYKAAVNQRDDRRNGEFWTLWQSMARAAPCATRPNSAAKECTRQWQRLSSKQVQSPRKDTCVPVEIAGATPSKVTTRTTEPDRQWRAHAGHPQPPSVSGWRTQCLHRSRRRTRTYPRYLAWSAAMAPTAIVSRFIVALILGLRRGDRWGFDGRTSTSHGSTDVRRELPVA